MAYESTTRTLQLQQAQRHTLCRRRGTKNTLPRASKHKRRLAANNGASRNSARDASELHSSAHSNKEFLLKLLSLGDSELRDEAAASADILSIDFLSWLKSREQDAHGADKKALDSLCGKLTALREGLDPIAAAQLLEAVRVQGAADEVFEETQALSEESLHLQIQQRKAELARRMALDAVSPAQLAREQSEALKFSEEQLERRAASTAALIGRAPAEMAQARKGLNAAAAAGRILDTLLSIQDQDERLAMVPEAFIPPQEGQFQEVSSATELVHTSPMRLLQAVALELRRLENHNIQHKGDYVPHDHRAMSSQDRKAALLDIKKAIFKELDKDTVLS